MRKKTLIIWLTLILLFPLTQSVFAESDVLDFYYTSHCQYCQKEIEWLKEFEKEKAIIVNYYNIDLPENRTKFNQTLDILELNIPSVPLLVDGNKAYQGFIEKDEFLAQQKNSSQQSCNLDDPCDDNKLFGMINPKTSPLFVVSALLGLIDGFNPCAMWVLIILLTFLIQVENRRKMAILGGAFILTSGLMYYLIIASWLNVRPLIDQVASIKTILSFILIGMGVSSLYKNHTAKKGCKANQGPTKQKIITQLQTIVSSSSFAYALIATIVLAVFVNIIELTCSLGIPLMFTELLSQKGIEGLHFNLYLFVYILFFILDDLIIFVIALKTFEIKGLSNTFTKHIQGIGSLLLIVFGLILLFKPALIGV
ncbi:thioredoxin family protein [Erysipelothrix urinaevulpis]|uniref:TlpA family protein disulfide reductase n=1 Tax=Erysipelothrix urinaevulpis TaxID=2683717 RepID=UPI00135A1AAD|nr:thioredoxin family protein [Erysipelothrix urinaevulpis]